MNLLVLHQYLNLLCRCDTFVKILSVHDLVLCQICKQVRGFDRVIERTTVNLIHVNDGVLALGPRTVEKLAIAFFELFFFYVQLIFLVLLISFLQVIFAIVAEVAIRLVCDHKVIV